MRQEHMTDGVEVLDLGDYDNLRPEEHAWLSRLADLWSAWGDKGYLRERLVNRAKEFRRRRPMSQRRMDR